MGPFLETLIGGLMTGMLYSLVALGFVLIFKASGVFNFAQGGEQHHRALGEVEYAAGLEDEHEAQGDQRIEHAGHEAADEGFEEKAHGSLNGSCRDRR